MTMRGSILRSVALALWLSTASVALFSQASTASAPAAAPQGRALGTIRAMAGSKLTVATDQGAPVEVILGPGTRLLRLAPGQTDWKNATPIQPGELAVGDRVLAKGSANSSGSSLQAATLLVMKSQDIVQMRRQELADWQRRGVSGLVRQEDAQAGTVTIAVSSLDGSLTVVVRTSPQTTYKRYAPGSVRWADSIPSRFDQIHPGDQLRAKGSRSADGSEMNAEEIVAGSFRNLSGQIVSIDAARQRLSLKDLATRKEITVQISADSEMRELPPRIAQALAERMHHPEKPSGADEAAPTASPEAPAAGPDARRERHGGGLEAMLARLPALSLEGLHKGDAVMIVSTMGSEATLPAAVTLLGGVEPLLTAAPKGGESESLLTPWSLASAPGEE